MERFEEIPYNAITYISRDDAKWLMSGWESDGGRSQDEGADGEAGDELMKARAVANATVKRLHELDINKLPRVLSPERVGRGFEIGELYPAHGVVVVDNIDMAISIENYLNRKFDQDRNRFPRSKGWRAVTTHSGAKEPFNHTHPFFHYRETKRLSQNTSRVLIVVDRAVEGMNNKYLAVMGIAKKTRSVLEIVQRLGRLVRSAHYELDGVMYAPPVSHDMVHVITHEGYENQDTLIEAMGFMRNMAGALIDMTSIGTFANFGVDAVDGEDEYNLTLSMAEEIIICDVVGEARLLGKRLSRRKLENRLSTRKRAKLELAWQNASRLAANDRASVIQIMRDMFRFDQPETLRDLIVDDKVRIDPLTMDEAKAWIDAKGFRAMTQMHEYGSDLWLEAVQEIHRAVEGQYYDGEMTTSQSVSGSIDELAAEVLLSLGMPKGHHAVVHRLVMEAVLSRLSSIDPDEERLGLGGDLDIPAVVAEIKQPKWRMEAQKWIRWQLCKRGYLPHMSKLFENYWSEIDPEGEYL